MTDPTAPARNAALRERRRAAGIVPVTVMVPEARKEELKTIAAQWRHEVQQGASVMTTAQQIRQHLDHGRGTRQVRITQNGEVHVKGSVDELDHSGWRFAGYVEDVLRQIERERSA